ncbi:hypothetical protein ACIA8C_33575 [Nocardia sp. NPDC051321]
MGNDGAEGNSVLQQVIADALAERGRHGDRTDDAYSHDDPTRLRVDAGG